jgi:enoyl-CoA hydratase/carnithine racemase
VNDNQNTKNKLSADALIAQGDSMNFAQYHASFSRIEMTRREGILLMRLHNEGQSLYWDMEAQQQFIRAFELVGSDRENRVIILTGAGEDFSGPRVDPDRHQFFHDAKVTATSIDPLLYNARKMLMNLINIEVPIIAAVNGPAKRHCDLVLSADIVLASEQASFEDTAHFHFGSIVPGDGISIVFTQLLGLNRARYLMLTGQVLSATEAKQLGLVSEILPAEKLLDRAWQLAEQLAKKSDMLLRNTRSVLIQPLRKALQDDLRYFLALESIGVLAHPDK